MMTWEMPDNIIAMEGVFSARMRAYRKFNGASQHQAGDLAGLTAMNWGRWERGIVPRLPIFLAFGNAAGMDYNQFFGHDGALSDEIGRQTIEKLQIFASSIIGIDYDVIEMTLINALSLLPSDLAESFATNLTDQTKGKSNFKWLSSLIDSWTVASSCNLGERFALFRDRTGLTQDQFAKAIGVRGPQTIVEWQNTGSFGPQNLFEFARFGINLNWLLTGEGEFFRGGVKRDLRLEPVMGERRIINTTDNDLRRRVDEALAEQGLSLYSFAQKIDEPFYAVANVASGRKRSRRIESMIAEAAGVKAHVLFKRPTYFPKSQDRSATG